MTSLHVDGEPSAAPTGGMTRIYLGHRFEVFRTERGPEGRHVVVKRMRDDRIDPRGECLLAHEFEVLSGLELSGVARPRSLEQSGGRKALVLEDAGAQDLAHSLRGQAMSIGAFLDLAIEMAGIVARLHRRRIIHRDICPANFVVNGGLTLVDFDAATGLPAFAPAAVTPSELVGTLAYMAPEQTGRIARLADHRVDLYSLGATLYEMLTGSPPFAARTPIALIHAHVALPPIFPDAVNPMVPRVLSDIVLKLLQKMPEARYQHAEALEADLERCRRDWQSRGQIAPFELGGLDIPSSLALAPRFHGRRSELGELIQAFDRVTAGGRELLLVAGRAGIGKTALVNEFRALVGRRCCWLTGKCDMLRGSQPYAPLRQTNRDLSALLAAQPETRRASMRERVRTAVEGNGGAILAIAPELEVLIGEQPSLPEVGPVEAENRLHHVAASLLGAVAAAGSPIIMFVDDLQWADLATLKALRAFATEPSVRAVLLLGAYRSEEVGPEHPLGTLLNDVQTAGARAAKLALGPLSLPDLSALVGDALRAESERAEPLARLLLDKTAGNPLVVYRFLDSLHESGLLTFNTDSRSWAWDLGRIASTHVADNVVDLLLPAIQRLPASTQRLLSTAACLGNQFDLGLLAAVSGLSWKQVGTAFWDPLREGLLLPVREGAPVGWAAEAPTELGPTLPPAYCFAHDRVQQACYHLLDDPERQQVHLLAGHALLRLVADPALAGAIFVIVDQLNLAVERLPDAERIWLAELNQRAGLHARAMAAYASALRYFQQAAELLPDQPWRAQTDLWFACLREGAECATLSGEHELAERFIEEGLAHTTSRLQQAALYTLAVRADLTRGRTDQQTVERGREGLRCLGVDLPYQNLRSAAQAELLQARADLAGRSPAQLLDLPLMEDPERRALLELLLSLIPPTWSFDPDLHQIVALRAASLTFRYGHTSEAPLAYGSYALALAMEGQYVDALSFGLMGVELARRLKNPVQECRALVLVGGALNHWCQPMRQNVALLRRASEIGASSGEHLYSAYAAALLTFVLSATGEDMGAVLGPIETLAAFCRRIAHPWAVQVVIPIRQAIRSLKGLTHAPPGFDDATYQESGFLAEAAHNPIAQATHHLFRMQLSYLFGDVASARTWLRAGNTWFGHLRTLPPRAEASFVSALVLAASSEQLPLEEREPTLAEAREAVRKLRVWSEYAPSNWRHKHDLAAAELARLEGSPAAALSLYLKAIEGAGSQGFIQDEALAHELTGRFHLRQGELCLASLHLDAALDRYARWGAPAKVDRLRAELETMPGIRLRLAQRASPTSSAAGSLDYLSLLQTAEAISSELRLDPLLEAMARICVEAASAERATIVLMEDVLVLRATANVQGGVLVERSPLERTQSLPASLIEQVHRSGQVIVLRDAAREGGYAGDPYIAEHGVRSVLALPIQRGDQPVGVLYCENNLTTDAFSTQRVEMLRLLSAQMATAIQNGLLYQEAQRAIQLRDEFLTIASHELRTPLASLQINVQALSRGMIPLTPEAIGKAVDAIERQVSRLTTLIDRLLQARDLETGQLALRPEPVDLTELTREVIGQLALELEQARCPVALVAPEPVVGLWDPAKLREVARSLLSNAMKFGAGEPVHVTVEAIGGTARLVVRDRGIGIAPERVPSIFGRFQRAVSVLHYGGFGLGLYVVRSIVEAHGGQVHVASALGSGAAFTVELPLTRSHPSG